MDATHPVPRALATRCIPRGDHRNRQLPSIAALLGGRCSSALTLPSPNLQSSSHVLITPSKQQHATASLSPSFIGPLKPPQTTRRGLSRGNICGGAEMVRPSSREWGREFGGVTTGESPGHSGLGRTTRRVRLIGFRASLTWGADRGGGGLGAVEKKGADTQGSDRRGRVVNCRKDEMTRRIGSLGGRFRGSSGGGCDGVTEAFLPVGVKL